MLLPAIVCTGADADDGIGSRDCADVVMMNAHGCKIQCR
jgi:hypothetical protein